MLKVYTTAASGEGTEAVEGEERGAAEGSGAVGPSGPGHEPAQGGGGAANEGDREVDRVSDDDDSPETPRVEAMPRASEEAGNAQGEETSFGAAGLGAQTTSREAGEGEVANGGAKLLKRFHELPTLKADQLTDEELQREIKIYLLHSKLKRPTVAGVRREFKIDYPVRRAFAKLRTCRGWKRVGAG